MPRKKATANPLGGGSTPARPANDAGGPVAAAQGPDDADQKPPIVDVWSRTASKYRVRAVVLLLLNVLLFGGLCTFAYWLRTGIAFAPAHSGYWHSLAETFQPSRDTEVSLGSLLTYPINVEEVPLQVVILGLLLAALVSIPILTAILYRFAACIPFLFAVCFVAMMPWLAITLTGSCILASIKPFRFQFRYASALLGLVLVLAYLYGAARTSAQPVETLPNPAERIKHVAPWLLATVASCLLMAFVLFIARMVNYRPGAIAPLLAVMFALPVALFEFKVGRDELHYRILEHDYGPGSAYFADRDVSEEFERAVRAAWESRKPPRPPLEIVRDSAELMWELNLNDAAFGRFDSTIARFKDAAVRKINGFLNHFPDSRYVVGALFLRARVLDMRVDPVALHHDRTLSFYTTFPSEASRKTWRMVYENGSDTPMAAVALLRLAQLDARAGRIDQAKDWLRLLLRLAESAQQQTKPEGGLIQSVLTRTPAAETLGVSADRYVLEGRSLLKTIIENRDPLYGYEPLIRLLRCNPRSEHYQANMDELVERYPSAQIADNAELAAALAEPDPGIRLDMLKRCLERHPGGDAAPEVLYRLGEAYGQLQDQVNSRGYYARLVREHPDSIWRQPAEEQLQVLPPAASSEP